MLLICKKKEHSKYRLEICKRERGETSATKVTDSCIVLILDMKKASRGWLKLSPCASLWDLKSLFSLCVRVGVFLSMSVCLEWSNTLQLWRSGSAWTRSSQTSTHAALPPTSSGVVIVPLIIDYILRAIHYVTKSNSGEKCWNVRKLCMWKPWW